MQVRVFESEDMDSALRMIKKALGPDALILSSRTVRKGGLGLFGKPVLEVTAAIDPNLDSAADPDLAAGDATGNGVPFNRAGNRNHAAEARSAAPAGARFEVPRPVSKRYSDPDAAQDEISYQQIWERSGVIESRAESLPDPYAQRIQTSPRVLSPAQRRMQVEQMGSVERYAADSGRLNDLSSEVGELRSLITTLVKDLPAQIEKASRPRIMPPVAPLSTPRPSRSTPADQLVHDTLTALGIEAEAAQTIAYYAASHLSARQMTDVAVLNAFFAKTIAELVQTTGSILPAPGESKRLALIGPTGVGKTTTIAKLAAAYLLSGGKRVAMVTIDTYRIAAVEQLKVYGEIMNLPVEVVMSAEQLRDVLTRHSNKDLILIDTAGRSPKDSVSLNELHDFLAVDDRIEPHLVLSATTRERDLYETYSRFSTLSPKSLLLTKLDECESLGVLLNIHLRNNCPISYLANGQKVPEDLVLANAELVSAMILESKEG